MHFCTECNNMYYIRIDSDNSNKLIYYCRHCGDENTSLAMDSVIVSNTQIVRSEQKFTNIINKYTKLDPTLPRINNVKCPHAECETNKEKGPEREIIYIRYDDMNMKYIYLCSHCDTVWKSDTN
jgi:DNA-directed RNA polymerase subunit M/transcription elongation factor TFIIS